MKNFDFSIMKGGWFVGNFEPTAFKTKDCEVAYVKHFKDQEWEKHFHKIATEITFIIKGKINQNDLGQTLILHLLKYRLFQTKEVI